MARTAEARRLTEMHRQAQLKLGAQTVRGMLSAWRVLDPQALDAAIPDWFRVAFPLISQQRRTSSGLAASYLTAFRAIEIGPSNFRPVFAGNVDTQALTTSLTVTGPVAVKIALLRGVPLADALEIGQSMSAAAAMRYVLDAGRDTLLGSLEADREALGWSRVSSGSACAFCAMLASRGAVYKSEESAGFESHDRCGCTAEPVYHRDAAWPAGSTRYREIWDRSNGTLEDFRRLLEDEDAA